MKQPERHIKAKAPTSKQSVPTERVRVLTPRNQEFIFGLAGRIKNGRAQPNSQEDRAAATKEFLLELVDRSQEC